MKPQRPFLTFMILCAVLFTGTGCAYRQMPVPAAKCAADLIAALSGAVPDTTRQLLVALPVRSDSTRGAVYLFERHAAGWSLHAGPLPAMVGRNGFAQPGAKREGDGRTPAGLFPLESAFGYASSAITKMPYRQATADDLWVDDVNSPEYNQWVRRGATTATSFEVMKLADHRYRYGVVTGYNRQPVVPGHGSAIFIHVWLEEGISTSGCVALSEADVVALLAWLDPAKNPLVFMGDPQDLHLLSGWSGSVATPVRCEQ